MTNSATLKDNFSYDHRENKAIITFTFSLDQPPVFARQIEYRLTATICAQHKLYNPYQYRLRQHLISKVKIVLSQTGRRQNMWTLQPPPMMKPGCLKIRFVRTTHSPFACMW